ncbi:ATPase family associated with various cellular activities (AAA) [Nitrosomonas aestuarii]|uniref:ATPase family associated with various cellular activities (AAA) n=1 Tax=Nitrosomonas aestuarii TaxID=52441 RepID=A0A1I3XZ47_9PROT|nr:ATP-binding protein [Nitrosomonas aestuarii]SFK24792.1 ATPase family associated with various cellular activities (AAA) [Nitrosomonas aestuarii]
MLPGAKIPLPLSKGKKTPNALALEKEIAWFKTVMMARFDLYFERETDIEDIHTIQPPDLTTDLSAFAQIVKAFDMGFDERLIVILALMPHLQAQALDSFLFMNKDIARCFTEFGGWQGKHHSGFLPTCETAVFILAGSDLTRRFQVLQLFQADHYLSKQGIIKITHTASGEPFLTASLTMTAEYLGRMMTGKNQKPDYDIHFPAKYITTALTWQDLVLSVEVMDEIENIKTWLQYSAKILQQWELGRHIKPGYRALFYGPPGTGKTLTATLIGAEAGIDVYRIDLSMVVSKYIGETEKNLANMFDQAINKNWILFFDEADALFGKRTQTSSANDRYANQEISYLLQRIEDYPGVIILATNLKANIDEAFARRFQTSVHFALPDPDQRIRLWRGMFSDNKLLSADVDLNLLAEKYSISGGAITNAVRYAAIRAIRKGRENITQNDLVKGITRELLKEGRTQ